MLPWVAEQLLLKAAACWLAYCVPVNCGTQITEEVVLLSVMVEADTMVKLEEMKWVLGPRCWLGL